MRLFLALFKSMYIMSFLNHRVTREIVVTSVASFALLGLLAVAMAYTDPTQSPPQGGTPPVNVGPTAQKKIGSLMLGSTAATPAGAGSFVTDRNVYVGTQDTGSQAVFFGELGRVQADFPSKQNFGLGFQLSTGFAGVFGADFRIMDNVNTALFKNVLANDYWIGAINKWASQLGGGSLSGASGTANYLSKFITSTSLGNSNVFDNGTNVGIGTQNPQEKLHVDGSAYVSGTIKGGDLHIANIATSFWNANSQSGLVFGYNNAMAVSLGMNSTNDAGFAVSNGTVPYAAFYSSGPSNDVFVSAYNGRNFSIDTSSAGPVSLQNRLYILNSNGNVGIGTMNPGYKLDVVGDVKGSRLCIGTDCRSSWPSDGSTATAGVPNLQQVTDAGTVTSHYVNMAGLQLGAGFTMQPEGSAFVDRNNTGNGPAWWIARTPGGVSFNNANALIGNDGKASFGDVWLNNPSNGSSRWASQTSGQELATHFVNGRVDLPCTSSVSNITVNVGRTIRFVSVALAAELGSMSATNNGTAYNFQVWQPSWSGSAFTFSYNWNTWNGSNNGNSTCNGGAATWFAIVD